MAMVSATSARFLSPVSVSPPKSPKFPSQLLSIANIYSPKTPNSFSASRCISRSRLVMGASASASNFSEKIGEILGDVSIFTVAGEPVMFKNLWDQNEGMAVVALLRHFGCPSCWELASELKESKSKFDSAGVKLIAIGVGTPDKARILAERLPFPVDCLYADPDCKAYDVLGLYHGFRRTFGNPARGKVFARLNARQTAIQNYTLEATPDDTSSILQQGGMLVFKGKQLLYAWKDEATGDYASPNDVLDICRPISVA